MEERGLSIAHTTIMRWVHQYGPELDERVRRHLKPTNDSWRVDETYIKEVNGCICIVQSIPKGIRSDLLDYKGYVYKGEMCCTHLLILYMNRGGLKI